MDFVAVVDQVIVLLRQRGRMTYRTLQRQFQLDDDALHDLTDALLYAHPEVHDEGGRGLVWTGTSLAVEPGTRPQAEAERQLHAVLLGVMALLQREQRVTYRTLRDVFGVDEACLHAVRDELRFRRLAREEDGQGLVWTGIDPPLVVSAPSSTPPTALAPSAAPSCPPLPPPEAPQPLPALPSTLDGVSSLPLDDVVSPTPEAVPVITPALAHRAPDAERRQLTVMFCDLADSTRLAQQLDAEDLREVMRAYQATAAAVIHQCAGHIAQYLGDGLLVYFGWPVAHEDDAVRGVHAGLGLVDAITTTLNPRLEREQGVQLAVRIGLHTGPVVVGEMGGGGRHEHLATGDTVHIAARLEGLAAPNTVVISRVTARLVRQAVGLEDLGPHALKGVAEPMPVWRVLGPLEAHADEPVAAGGPFLVGRDEELGLLRRRWEQAKERLGQVVLLSGTAGLGKSALTAVLRTRVREEGWPRIALRCSAYHQNSALYPVITHVERVLDVQREDTPTTRLTKLEQGLRPLRLPLAEVVPLFASLLSVPLDGRYAAPTLTPQQQKQQMLDALVAWLLAAAERQPVLVVWEDLHWADPSTLEMLGLVLEQTPTVPMLHVLTARPEFVPPWPMRSHMTPLTLTRLERPQVTALITHLAGGKALPAEVVQHLVAKTDGVPLYVEELTKMLLQSPLLREDADHYTLTGPLGSVAIPATLQDALMARLDQLPTAKEVAQLGAVLGREFAYDLVQGIAHQDEDTLQAGLVQLVAAELLYQRGRPPRSRYVFKHALVQDTAYASLLKSTRQQIHQRIAQVLEAQYPDLVVTQPELLAHHLTEAGHHAQAVAYWQRAGESAVARSAHLEAISHCTTGLEVLRTLPETAERLQQELLLQTTLGPAFMITKGFAAPEVEHAYARARALCQRVGETPQRFSVLRGLWQFYNGRGAYQTACELGEQCLHLAQQGHDTAYLLEAHHTLWTTRLLLGELPLARAHLEQGLALYDPQQHRALAFLYGHDPGVCGRSVAAVALWVLGYPDQALWQQHAAHTLAQELAHPPSLAFTRMLAAMAYQLRREAHAAHEQAEALIALATEQGFALFLAIGGILRGGALTALGHRGEQVGQIRQELAAVRETGTALWVPYFLGLLAEAYAQEGQVEVGLATLAEALAAAQATGERWGEAELYRLRGVVLLRQPVPQPAEAEPCLQRALEIARRQEAKAFELRAAMSLSRLWQQQGKQAEAHELLAPVYGWFTEGFDTADLQEAKALLTELRE